jgi:hypothetical protein
MIFILTRTRVTSGRLPHTAIAMGVANIYQIPYSKEHHFIVPTRRQLPNLHFAKINTVKQFFRCSQLLTVEANKNQFN